MEKPRRDSRKTEIPNSESSIDNKRQSQIEQDNAELVKGGSRSTQQTAGTTPSPSSSPTTAQQLLHALKTKPNSQSASGQTPISSTSMDDGRKRLAKLKEQSTTQQNSGTIPGSSPSSSSPSAH
ncbi:hypothetical protein PCC9214_05538 [Planktothrix tepida]|uniref:Uncharacterized protein n=1 Tax=Planktothrix tepida PCC 9214 TaxID=671072 RepID=A0A1J1LS98_9CYAN|nr:hypothetical protein [Planktothrix tepida]CAD5989316.1 hypothetical protein PCC9214_05538 [Planktothrix tepida]CUR35461.1 hypothetical protein PL9214670087 [Planktothrix tepida PCC 9214]